MLRAARSRGAPYSSECTLIRDMMAQYYPGEEYIGHSLSMDIMSRYFPGDHLPQHSPTDPLLRLISLQKASGCWLLDPVLAAVLGKTSKEVVKSKPAQVNQDVWATVLALIWLHGFKADAKEEWELLAMKAVSWLRAQNAPCMKECVEAGNTVLGCKVATDALGF